MKRYISIVLAVFLLIGCLSVGAPAADAAKKATKSRAIAIVFDNSGSMYFPGEAAWCRATYAMEVFASMLNEGDVLQIYPMWPIKVEGKTYDMKNPYQITDVTKATAIEDLSTPEASGTPIQTIDHAASGLQKLNADLKYLIILTDGTYFHAPDGTKWDTATTVVELDKKVEQYAGKGMTMMFLGIDSTTSDTEACLPSAPETASFVKRRAEDSADVLSSLTAMCNQIFGRDAFADGKNISGRTVEFNMSMGKLIVFVQGTDISDLKLTGGSIGNPVLSQQTKYATKGADNRNGWEIDKSLQGMIVTYEDVPAGTYTIDYKGKESSVEVYFEPDADLAFEFTDAEGNKVNFDELYEGDYTVTFGLKDGQTGQWIESDLLGDPQYEVTFYHNDQTEQFQATGKRNEKTVSLKKGDTFSADLKVTYLKDYTEFKSSSDFGWPEGGITIASKPAGVLKINVSGGQETYPLEELESGEPYVVEVTYEGQKLTGQDLVNALSWDNASGNANLVAEFADDHCKLYLKHKNPDAPLETPCGDCTVSLKAAYTPQGSDEVTKSAELKYTIKYDAPTVKLEMSVPQNYIVIKEMQESKPITVKLRINGVPLTAEEFANAKINVDCGGLKHTVTPNEQGSSYTIKLLPAEGLKEGVYDITVTGTFIDKLGNESATNAVEDKVTLSNMPMWMKWAIGLLFLLILCIIAWIIMHIKVMPKNVRHNNPDCMFSVAGKNETEGTTFKARRDGKTLKAQATFAGNTVGIKVADLVPGPNSFLCTPNKKRSMLVRNPGNSVKAVGEITSVDINGVSYQYQQKTGKLEPVEEQQRPYKIGNGCYLTFEGKMNIGGKVKKFRADIPVIFKK